MSTKPHSKTHPFIDAARDVLRLEIEGIEAIYDTLDDDFIAIIELLAKVKGRVIVSGMGKSGHIARKIAATMASTGTPAYFVHPSEASHGDLGMITKDDAVICLSNSGETSELRDMIAYTRRYGIPLIGIARREGSALTEAADIGIVLPEIPEASPTGAPTTSTTMTLAYGDAIAMALLTKKGFSRDDFGALHPGGKLGKAFVRVGDLMHGADELPTTKDDAPMRDVLLVMTAKRFGCAGVVNAKGEMIGIITDGDLRRHIDKDLMNAKAVEVMTKNPITITRTMLAAEALGIMNDKSITCLFVLEGAKPVGIIHIHDCLRAGVM
ncbi:MAG: KpsF/GutQ family sugar-phosphate isomerase [Rickettsiales bacterium]